MATEDIDQDPVLSALRDLVQSRGWQLFRQQAAAEFGPAGYGRTMQAAISQVPAGPDRPYELARIAEQVDATAKAVDQILRWPEEQIRSLTAQYEKPKGAFAGLRRIGR